MLKEFELKFWNDATEKRKEMYARLDVIDYLESINQEEWNRLYMKWDESVMEVGDDFYNNAEAVGRYAYEKEFYSEESYFGLQLFTYLKENTLLQDAIKSVKYDYDHYFEDAIAEAVQGGSGESGPEMSSSYFGIDYDVLDEDYMVSILDYCNYCGWYMKHEDLNFGEVVYCDQCKDEYIEEYGDDE